MSQQTTAILIFARSAYLDAKDKGLHGGERFLEELTSQAILTARRTGLPYFHFDENAQEGVSFGERLGNAMQNIYDRGIEHLVVIGNDSPDLRTKALLKAADKLSEGKSVFGPSGDGGTYLIGISRSKFDLDTFVRLPWQQNDLLEKLILWSLSSGTTHLLLKSKLDLDTLTDCRSWFAASRFISAPIRRLLLSFMALSTLIRSISHDRVFTNSCAVPFNKGSPF